MWNHHHHESIKFDVILSSTSSTSEQKRICVAFFLAWIIAFLYLISRLNVDVLLSLHFPLSALSTLYTLYVQHNTGDLNISERQIH